MMIFNIWVLLSLGIGYLLIFFLLAYAVEREWIARTLSRHPLVYVLSIGVFCSAWSFYGTTGLAYEYGTGYMAYYLGVSGAFLLYPFILRPILRITRTYVLGSLADLFAFRYRSRWAGTLTTIFMLMAVLPLIALQVQAITDVIVILNKNTTPGIIGFAFCVVLIAFTILYGAREISPRERHRSLIFAIAFESLFKMVVLVAIGLFAVYQVFGSFEDLEDWLKVEPVTIASLQGPLAGTSWLVLMGMFLVAPLTMPHMFHTIYRENRDPKNLKIASWAFPLYALIMSVPVLPILWAGMKLGFPTNPEYFSLGIGLGTNSSLFTILAYLGGLSAASGITIVATLALASMFLNHAILPFYQPSTSEDIYEWLLWVRRILIATIILAGYLVYLSLAQIHDLSSLGIASFMGTLQFLPGLIGVLFWSGANRSGFLAGLCAGMLIWIASVLYPLASDSFSLSYRVILQFAFDESAWSVAALTSLGVNSAVFIFVSLITRTSREEMSAADACSQNSLARPKRQRLVAKNTDDFIEHLSRSLGKVSAEREVTRALKDLNLPMGEYRPFALRRLRDKVENNLSGLMGPSVAQALIARSLPYEKEPDSPGREDIHFVEQKLAGYHYQLTGLAGELDSLRRYHRDTLESLPIGVCSIASDGEILMWNRVLEEITGIDSEAIIGSNLESLPAYWSNTLSEFVQGHSTHAYKKELKTLEGTRWLNLHKAALPESERTLVDGNVILVEDHTDIQLLEEELVHSERLASIGSLAAGVAHEIGNPVTGIDSLAQELKYISKDPAIAEVGVQIREQTKRVTNIVQSLVNFAHAGTADKAKEFNPHDIAEIVQDAIKLLELSRKSRDVIFENRLPQGLNVICDPQRLVQVFINLLSNARDASEPGTIIYVQTVPITGTHRVRLEVVDHGTGIEEQHLDRIFDPFYTTKGVGKGTGLGLWLAYSIIEEHFGQISIESPAFRLDGKGTRVIITLPRAHEEIDQLEETS